MSRRPVGEGTFRAVCIVAARRGRARTAPAPANRVAGGVFPTIEDGGRQPRDAPAPQRFGAADGSVGRHANHTHIHPSSARGVGLDARARAGARFVHAAARGAARRPKTTIALWLTLIAAWAAS